MLGGLPILVRTIRRRSNSARGGRSSAAHFSQRRPCSRVDAYMSEIRPAYRSDRAEVTGSPSFESRRAADHDPASSLGEVDVVAGSRPPPMRPIRGHRSGGGETTASINAGRSLSGMFLRATLQCVAALQTLHGVSSKRYDPRAVSRSGSNPNDDARGPHVIAHEPFAHLLAGAAATEHALDVSPGQLSLAISLRPLVRIDSRTGDDDPASRAPSDLGCKETASFTKLMVAPYLRDDSRHDLRIKR